MRVIIFLLKCLVGLFASIGLLTVAFFALTGVLINKADDFRAQRIDVPERIILTLEADTALAEVRSQDIFSQASFVGGGLVLREAVAALENASRDPAVVGLALHVGRGDIGMAQLQELRQAIKRFKESGKRVFAFAETFGETGNGTLHYYLGSIADELWLQPSGDLDLTGFALESPFLRDALDEYDVEPQIAQREEYKGAMSFLTENRLPEPQRENLGRLVESWLIQVIRDVAAARHLDSGTVRGIIDGGPYQALTAMELGLVDKLGYRDELIDAQRAFGGDGADFLSLARYRTAHPVELPDSAPVIAMIYGVGPISFASSQHNPVFADGDLSAEAVAEAIRDAVDDSTIEAIIFRVDSPGGSYVASDTIWREVVRARERGKPLILSMGNLAASGGYFVAAPAQTIVAQPGTITGSIGVVGGKVVTKGLFERFGVRWDGVKAGANADLWSANKPFDEGDWALVEAWMDSSYEDFLAKVAGGRSLSEEEVRKVAKGQVWTGEDAAALGLVDALGGYPEAIAFAKQAAGIDPQTAVRIEQRPPPFDALDVFAEQWLGDAMQGRAAGTEFSRFARLYDAMRPLMRLFEEASEDPRKNALRSPPLEIR